MNRSEPTQRSLPLPPGEGRGEGARVIGRRDAIKLMAAASLTAATAQAQEADESTRSTPAKAPIGLVIHSYWVRSPRPLAPRFSPISDAIDFAEHAARVGAAGVQIGLKNHDAAYLDRLRSTVERHGLYYEGMAGMPKDKADVARFEADIVAAKAAGALVVRSTCLSGRRYETFDTYVDFQEFAARSWRSLTAAEPIVARHGMRLAIENHKDWRIDELLAGMERISSEYVGICLDTGNSIALLEEPHEVVEAYAPWTFTTHLKDMHVSEYGDGFLLSEVPLGEGLLDLTRIASTLEQAERGARLNLEMITRDPLKVPCLTSKYWATLVDTPARELAVALAWVRKNRHEGPLPTISNLDHAAQLEREESNVAQSLDYARAHFA